MALRVEEVTVIIFKGILAFVVIEENVDVAIVSVRMVSKDYFIKSARIIVFFSEEVSKILFNL